MDINQNLTEVTKPSDRITITIDKEPKEIFMSAGLSSRLHFMCSNLENFTELYTNLPLQMALVLECLVPRTKHGEKDVKEITLDDFEMTRDDYKVLLEWVQQHVMYFFFEYLSDLMKLKDPNNPTAQLMEYWSGILGSQTEKPSVGPSTA